MYTCFIAGNITNLEHMDKMVSPGFLYCEIGMFPLVTNKYPGGDTLRLFKYPVSLYLIITNF